MNQRPQDNEYVPYFGLYIAKAKGDEILQSLATGEKDLLDFMQQLPADKWDYKYGPDKWTIKEALLHLIDTERIFAYRALRVGRHDATPLAGFDQDDYVPHYQADQRSSDSIIAEYRAVRNASKTLFENFAPEDLTVIGSASGGPVSCRALAFMIAGHEQHHLDIFRERY